MQNTQIYWEKQGDDRLCAVHCINSLLQGPIFSEFDLAQIGLEIDREEQKLLCNQDQNSEIYKQNQKDGSHNVGDDALNNYNNIQLQNAYQQLKKNEDLCNETGFICNLDKHWFCIRKIQDIWFNLNSTNQGPDIISDFYLSAFLQSVLQEGYTIFMVKGQYLKINNQDFISKHQFFFTLQQCQELHKIKKNNKQFKMILNGNSFQDIEQALKNQNQNQNLNQNQNQEKEQEQKMVPFQGKGFLIQNDCENFYEKQANIDDPEMNQAIQMSLMEKFENEPQNGFQISFRLPEGGSLQRIFDNNAFVEDLYDYIKFKQNPEKAYKFILMMGYPRKPLKLLNETLFDKEFDKQESIFVTKI